MASNTEGQPMVRRTLVVALLMPCAASAAGVAPARADPSGGTAYATPAPAPKRVTAAQAPLPSGTVPASTTAPGGTVVPTAPATVTPDGQAVAPADAPPAVVALIAAGNVIAATPYRYGGGHRSFEDTAYDCSGSVSYALHGAGLLDWTLDSTGLSRWGSAGPGTWVTIYANKTHTYLVVAGLRFDTSGRAAAGTRWQPALRSSRGFKVRHPRGL